MFKRKSAQQNNPQPVAPSAGRPSISSVASSAQPHMGIGDRVMSFNSIETSGSQNTVKNRRMSNFLGLGGKKKDKGKEREDEVSFALLAAGCAMELSEGGEASGSTDRCSSAPCGSTPKNGSRFRPRVLHADGPELLNVEAVQTCICDGSCGSCVTGILRLLWSPLAHRLAGTSGGSWLNV